jgi:DNA repair protein RadC
MPEMMYLDHEQVRILVLDTKNQVMENISRYQGTVNSSVLRAAEIYRAAVIRNCPAVIVCHNHPSGDPTPSPKERWLLTRPCGAMSSWIAGRFTCTSYSMFW